MLNTYFYSQFTQHIKFVTHIFVVVFNGPKFVYQLEPYFHGTAHVCLVIFGR
jgi:hypothetical protein